MILVHCVGVRRWLVKFVTKFAIIVPKPVWQVVPLPSGSRIVWPGVRRKSWLDVKAGDVIRVKGRQRVVWRVWPYRTSLCFGDHPEVKSGREWFREMG